MSHETPEGEQIREAAKLWLDYIFGRNGFVDGSRVSEAVHAAERIVNAPAASPPAADTGCIVSPFSSRMCELGTKACNVRHTAADTRKLIELLKKTYNLLLDQEEKSGWPGDEPFWSLRQDLRRALVKHGEEV